MKLRIGGLMLILLVLLLSLTAFGRGLGAALVNKGFRPATSVAPPLVPYAPQIVARVELKGQRGNTPQTAIFTPPADGLFRISAYAFVVKASGAGEGFFFNIAYRDDIGRFSSQGFFEYPNGEPGCQGSVDFTTPCSLVSAFRATAGAPIVYSTGVEGCADSCELEYDLYFTLERLD